MADRQPRFQTSAGTSSPRRVFAFNGGSFTNKRIRAILSAADLNPSFGLPGPDDAVLAWGFGVASRRAEWIASRTGAKIIRLEDPFFRSVRTGRDGDATMGILIDHRTCHFDSSAPSDLEYLLTTDPLDDPTLLTRAKDAMAEIRALKLSKYNMTLPNAARPDPGYVLVIDQTRGDASITRSGANVGTFADMLHAAQSNHPNDRIVIKTHPETRAGHRPGHFQTRDLRPGDLLWDAPTPVQDLFDGAIAVYVVSSQMGFEAILNGHAPRVFGQPFYAGWGLTTDHQPITRRKRILSPEQLFAGACLIYPTWYDPFRDELCAFETMLQNLAAQTRAWREDHLGWSAHGMRLWKRNNLKKIFGTYAPMTFDHTNGPTDRPAMVWGAGAGPDGAARLEDGFLRSNGLGAALVPPMSLVLDHVGIYFDATRPSRLEELIAQSPNLPQRDLDRADRLADMIRSHGVSKYSPKDQNFPTLPPGHKVLVPGQVEDDASIRLGTVDIQTNADLLRAVRKDHPDAVIIYKPHPDVLAGLRPGAVEHADQWADIVLDQSDPITAIRNVDAVHTMTSLLGFEALLHGVPVTCHGQPFYAGWGLTTDKHPHPRRGGPITLSGLIHATLIAYPRYFDPKTGLACPAEVIVKRLAEGDENSGGPALRILSKLQGALATYSHLWR